MNIKSLLLGSAAALVAVSGARAADAVVVAEPEPVEYVRVCDVYGAGFFYIPGTETCLKFDGYFRFDLGFGDATGLQLGGDASDDTYSARMRAALRWDARSETELGTLRGYAHINFDYNAAGAFDGNGNVIDGSGTNTTINHAWIELGGFRIGKSDSYFSTITGYTSGVSNDGTLVGYGPFDTQFISYTFTGGNGFTATVAAENGAGFGLINDYVPHVVAGFGWTQGWGGISAVGAYDSVAEEGAFKARLDVNVSDQLSLFVMGGYSTNDSGFAAVPNNRYAVWSGDWAVWAGGAFKLNEKATINAEVAYDEREDFHVVANVDYQLVKDFHIIPEVVYRANLNNANIFPTGDDEIGGFIRFQRNF
jgi:hypothetical protein